VGPAAGAGHLAWVVAQIDACRHVEPAYMLHEWWPLWLQSSPVENHRVLEACRT
jgi:hypothetical protein